VPTLDLTKAIGAAALEAGELDVPKAVAAAALWDIGCDVPKVMVAVVLLPLNTIKLTKAIAAVVMLGGKISTNGLSQAGIGLTKVVAGAAVMKIPASATCECAPTVEEERTCSFTAEIERC